MFVILFSDAARTVLDERARIYNQKTWVVLISL